MLDDQHSKRLLDVDSSWLSPCAAFQWDPVAQQCRWFAGKTVVFAGTNANTTCFVLGDVEGESAVSGSSHTNEGEVYEGSSSRALEAAPLEATLEAAVGIAEDADNILGQRPALKPDHVLEKALESFDHPEMEEPSIYGYRGEREDIAFADDHHPKERSLQSDTPSFVIRTVVKMTRHLYAQQVGNLIENQDTAFYVAFMATIVANSPDVTEVVRTELTQAKAETNFDQTPIVEDFTQNAAFSAIQAARPWCDYGITHGRPGYTATGLDYSAGRNSIFCDGLHDGLVVVSAAGFSDFTKVFFVQGRAIVTLSNTFSRVQIVPSTRGLRNRSLHGS